MDLFGAIKTRRSIRKYTSQPVPVELVKKLVSAASQAPSAGNQQPWHFIVVTRREQLNALAEVLPNGKMLTHAPLGIVVCGDMIGLKHPDCWIQDCSAATQNLLLTAHASGLGAVWLGVYPRQDRIQNITRLSKLPDHAVPLCVVALGFPAERVEAEDRFRDERVHYDVW
jgi:nitroreductase